jgi:type II secretory pathway predicted ATPase ExeA
MYLDYWGLKEQPFANVPDRDKFFRSNQHDEALVRLLYAVEQRKGAAMLTGKVGSGKTTISRVLMKKLSKGSYEVKSIVNPALSPVDLIRAILLELGEKAVNDSKTVLLSLLHDRLYRNADRRVITVLIIDEAHLIPDRSSFEELRMLLNLQSDDHFLITLIMLGQPPLLKKISELKPLKERISIKYDLSPLSLQDTIRYILFRLKITGASRGIFTKKAVIELYDHSEGIPLKVNNICDRSLLMGMMMKARVIDKSVVAYAVEDLK